MSGNDRPGRWPAVRWLRRRAVTVGLLVTVGMFTAGFAVAAGSSAPAPETVDLPKLTVTDVVAAAAEGRVTGIQYDVTSAAAAVHYRGGRVVPVDVPEPYAETLIDRLVRAGVAVVPATGVLEASPAADSGGSMLVPLLFFAGVLAGFITLATWTSRRSARRELPGPARPGKEAAATTGPREVEPPSTRFTDVAGVEEAVADLAEMVAFLQDPAPYHAVGAKSPRGALLTGPPGTGKTLLARAVAGEAEVPFYAASGSDFVEKYVGVGARRIRELFAQARKHPKAVVFIDEVDAVARRRAPGGDVGNHAESENTLIALLAELDGFHDRGDILLLAATNRPDVLDQALTRPGRLDRRVEVPNPDRRGREKILALHAADRPLTDDVDLLGLARRTPGFSGAQLAALVNEACMEAARRSEPSVGHDCFSAAVATLAMGRARESALVTEEDRVVTAWHEAGHTVAAFLVPDADDPVSVSIVPRGPAGGVTWMGGSDHQFMARRKAHAQLVVALAGRAAEELLLDGEYTQGASGDLSSATALATRMATQWGMTRLGYTVRDPHRTDALVTEVVEELLATAHTTALELLGRHRVFLTAVVNRLLDEETISYADVSAAAVATEVTGPALVAVPALPAPAGRRRDEPPPAAAPEPAIVPRPRPRPRLAPVGAIPALRGLAARARERRARTTGTVSPSPG